MSINFKRKPSIEQAAEYNSKSTYVLPSYVTNRFPKLLLDRGSLEFAWGVHDLQFYNLQFRGPDADGMLGYKTYTALLQLCKRVNSEYVISQGQRIQLPKRSEYHLFSFDEPQGKDLHRFGNFSTRREVPTALCLHWGGLNAEHCFNVFASEQRKVSSHFLIGKLSANKVVVYQTIDLSHAAWHGGHVNQWTIGIDICQSPSPKWKDHYMVEKRGMYDVAKIDNPTDRGPKKVLNLDPVLAEGARLFVEDLMEALDMPVIIPQEHRVYEEEELRQFTAFGHHHCNHRKYDIACWWDNIFPAHTFGEV